MATEIKQGTFSILRRGEASKLVSGYVCGHIGIHKDLGCWKLSHIPTGYSLRTATYEYRLLKNAKAVAIEISKLTDWATIDGSQACRSEEDSRRLYDSCKAIARAHGALANG